jgi:pectinesterase
MTRLGVSTPLATLALAIGAVALALTATAPRGCDAAAAVVARSISVSNKKPADFKSIQAAIDSIPFGNNQWIRIHVDGGVYL